MPNKMKRSRTEDNPLQNKIAIPGNGGVFGANPAPGFREYPETKGNVLPPTKFADSDFGTGIVKENKLARVTKPSIVEEMGLKKPGTTTIIKASNKLSRNVKSNGTGKDKL